CSLTSYSQADTKYRLLQYRTEMKGQIKVPEWHEANDLLVVFGTKRITIYSKEPMTFDFIGEGTTFYDEDLDANILKTDAIDDVGKKCQIWAAKYQSPTTEAVVVLMLFYEKITWAYRLKKAE